MNDMNKDCNGCFGAAGDDCQRCQEVDEVTPPKLDITPDPTAGDAIRACGRMPTHIYNIYSVINNVAGLHGLEITGLRDKKTGKEWRRER